MTTAARLTGGWGSERGGCSGGSGNYNNNNNSNNTNNNNSNNTKIGQLRCYVQRVLSACVRADGATSKMSVQFHDADIRPAIL